MPHFLCTSFQTLGSSIQFSRTIQSARLEAALEQLQQNQEVQEGLKDLLGKLEGKLPTGSQLEFEQYIKLMEQTAVQLDQAVADLEKLPNHLPK